MNEKFKKEVAKLIKEQKNNVQDKGLYNEIEKLIKEDPEMKEWLEAKDDVDE